MSVKCVVWDLDGTVWDPVAVELPDADLPEPRPEVLEAMARLSAAGVVNAVASRTDPAVGDVVDRLPELAKHLVAREIGWQDKSRSLEAIAAELGIGLDTLLLVDDSEFERAEVRANVGVPGLDPADFRVEDHLPERISSVAAGRTAHYQAEAQRRDAAKAYADRTAFLASCAMRLTLGQAAEEELPRVAELVRRAHRLSSTHLDLDEPGLDRWRTGTREIVVARLVDRFGDYGLIGVALVTREAEARVIDLLAVSCRVAGRGVAGAFVTAIANRAELRLELPIVATSANAELRLLVRGLGFELTRTGPDALLATADAGRAGELPEWITLTWQEAP